VHIIAQVNNSMSVSNCVYCVSIIDNEVIKIKARMLTAMLYLQFNSTMHTKLIISLVDIITIIV
jgi:hypothetical protein